VQNSWACRIFCDTVSNSYKRKAKAIPENIYGRAGARICTWGNACMRPGSRRSVTLGAAPPDMRVCSAPCGRFETAKPPAKAQSESVERPASEAGKTREKNARRAREPHPSPRTGRALPVQREPLGLRARVSVRAFVHAWAQRCAPGSSLCSGAQETRISNLSTRRLQQVSGPVV
jgi:hypothetical protein